MNFTQEQMYEILSEVVSKEEGLEQILKMSLEIFMQSERHIHNERSSDLGNGFRPRKTYGHGKRLELRVPRTRSGNFYPLILGLLRDQEEECRRIAFKLYSSGLTTEQVGDLFGELYGQHYSTSQVSRLFDYAREEVSEWLHRPLDTYYPICYIDATFIPTRRVDSVSKEAYFTILGVKSDRTREVLSVVNNPTEGSSIWDDIFMSLKSRGVREINLFVSDGLSGIEDVVHKHFKEAEVQLCAVHLERECLKNAKPKHKAEMAEDLKEVFVVNDKTDTKERGIKRWKTFCVKWGKYYPVIANKGKNERYELYFTYLGYHYKIRSMIYTTNWIERLNKDYKRTTKMRGALPNVEATILLLCSVAMTRKAYSRIVPNIHYEKNKFRWEE
jgi:transposase-like protein